VRVADRLGLRALPHPLTRALVRGLLVTGVTGMTGMSGMSGVSAQQPASSEPDTAQVALLDELVVIADRAPTPIAATIGAVTRLDARALRVTRFAGAAEALRMVPGFALVDRDGSGLDPQPIVRGFYGGGEAEYVVVLLDGKPMNALQSGLMAWELIDPVAIEAVEVLRGASSSLYGDAALGGVVNFITADDGRAGGRLRLLGAGHGLFRGGFRASESLGGRVARVHAAALRTDGFRDHGARRAADLGVSYDLTSGARRELTVSVGSTWRAAERPGPLSAAELGVDRSGRDPFYRFDETSEWVHTLGLDGTVALGDSLSLSGWIGSELRRSTDVRTIPLTPEFADTKERSLGADRVALAAQIVWDEPRLPWSSRLVTGIDATWGRLDSEHFAVVSGPRAAYASADGSRGAVDASGEGVRLAGAAFAQLELWPFPALRLSLGARYDHLRDRFEPRAPSASGATDAAHSAFSPKVGASLRWIRTSTSTGRVYVAAGGSFKAATPDQLFDQRSIPLPFPPFSAATSNPMLVPQHGVSLEAGAYHAFAPRAGPTSVALSLSVYRMEMEDEIDFDLATLRYVNIGQSRHRGIEASVTVDGLGPGAGYIAYTLQSATARSGAFTGRSLKAIPRHGWSGGVSAAVGPGLEAAADLTRSSGAWLDDDNTIELDSFTRVDVRLTADTPAGTAFLEVRNALGARYSTTGFPDPSGSGTVYYHPASGRTLGLGMALDW
jgi:outer membrane receptor protein involved in Fe transport